MTGIVDEALGEGEEDRLNVSSYTNALVNFIKETNTPMTIGIQGEWGSGKTSMLNQIKHSLDESNRDDGASTDFKQIWVNAWENSLLCSPEEALLKIINHIIQDLLVADKDVERRKKITAGAGALLKGALRVGAAVAAGSAGKEVIDEALGVGSNPVKELRAELTKLVEDVRKGDTPYQCVVVYVDDLDRIVPESAVRILELLKNIFNIPGCVFVLAIDYQVVVKGLESKFGKPTVENEWEFRAFFDKIIQLPFKMPMGRYSIGDYVNGLLKEISFHEGVDLPPDLIDKIIQLSIGGNPRSIKRLINSLSLIEMFNEEGINKDNQSEKRSEQDSLLLFACVCLQISYPDVYDLLGAEPNFTEWNEEFAFKKTQKKEEKEGMGFEENFKIMEGTNEFDEPWEQALYRICYLTPTQRAKVISISQLLTLIRTELDIKDDELSEKIIEALKQTAVTSISVVDNPNIRPREAHKAFYISSSDEYLEIAQSESGCNDQSILVTKKILDMLKTDHNAADAELDGETGKPIYSKDSNKLEISYTPSYAALYLGGAKVGVVDPSKKGGANITIRKKAPNFLLLKKGNLTATHCRHITIKDEDARILGQNAVDVNYMLINIAGDNDQDYQDLKVMVDHGIEATKIEVEVKQKFEPKVKQYMKDFTSARKNSNKHKEAVDWIKSYFMTTKYEEL